MLTNCLPVADLAPISGLLIRLLQSRMTALNRLRWSESVVYFVNAVWAGTITFEE